MSSADWQELGAVAPTTLGGARDAAHGAAQWPSRAARAALPAAEDDSHSNLGWDGATCLLRSHDLGAGHRVGFSIARFALVHMTETGVIDEFALSGRGQGDIIGWLSGIPAVAGGDTSWLDRALPYELPSAVAAESNDMPDSGALAELERWYANAAGLLEEIATADPGPSDVRCWPHHFDIATLITLAGAGEEATTIGAGMSPGDGSYPDPYLYVTPWPYPPADALPDLPTIGHWHTDGFVGAIVTAARIVEVPDQGAAVRGFLHDAIAACRAVQVGS
tara:strand:- start:70222 stop:71055 length:834 start_codon:yes stop_codon:yes gene_type:complete